MPEKSVKWLKIRASPSASCTEKLNKLTSQPKILNCLSAKLIPWSEFEQEYAQNFETEMGPPAKTFRLALAALIIKEKLGISDRETVEQIRENPYLQYFIGHSSYSNEAPFDPSLLVHFRQRISAELVNKVNRAVVRRLREASHCDSEKKTRTTERSAKKSRKTNPRRDLCSSRY